MEATGKKMTHDELLIKIDEEIEHNLNHGGVETGLGNAVRTVVELHQQRNDNSCQHCVTWYPCDTIKAIEKELA